MHNQRCRMGFNNPSLIITVLVACMLSVSIPVQGSPSLTLAQVHLKWPANDGGIIYATADHPRALPRFEWEPVAGAVSYKLEISADKNMDSGAILASVSDLPFEQWAPDKAVFPDNVDLYWHVRVEKMAGNSGPGPYSEIWTFQKNWLKTGATPTDLNQPALLLPEKDAVIAYNDPPGGDTRPAFSWTPVLGATHYDFQLSFSADFNPISYHETTINTNLQLAEKPADGSYYWRVVPYQQAAQPWQGQPSEARVVTFDYLQTYLPQLLEPADGADLEYTPTFHWQAVRGAQEYVLQYSTESDFPVGPKTGEVTTYATRYTPSASLINDQSYYWRVRVISASSHSLTWTPYFTFHRKWAAKPTLLTPVDGFLYVNEPFFSWTPVSGAASYKIEMDDELSFSSPLVVTEIHGTNYVYASQTGVCPFHDSKPVQIFWRVTPDDGDGNPGSASDVATFTCDSTAQAPVQVYPLMFGTLHDTAPAPVFEWKRVLLGEEQSQAAGYRIQVFDHSDSIESSNPLWSYDTANMNAVPTLAGALPHGDGQNRFFWRVRPLDKLGSEIEQWSQTWEMRYNPALLPPASNTLQLLRPAQGSEWAETAPLLEWLPLKGANAYHVQISMDSSFAMGTDVKVEYPAYSIPDHLEYGTYYWRVQGLNGSTPLGEWSGINRFQVAAQSRWRAARTLGENNSPIIAMDLPDDISPDDYDLTDLAITQDAAAWYFGFHVNPGSGAPVKLALYLDTDQQDNSGGTEDPRGYKISAIPAHLPEFVIYLDRVNGSFSAENVRVYVWNPVSSIWNSPILLSSMTNCDLSYNDSTGYVEIKVSKFGFGQAELPVSLSAELVSLMNDIQTHQTYAQDSTPADPNVDNGVETSLLSRFTSVTARLTTILPPFSAVGDPSTAGSPVWFAWQPPVEEPALNYYSLRIGIDPQLNTWLFPDLTSRAAGFTFPDPFDGDIHYFWQVYPVYSGFEGGWSQSAQFSRKSLAPQNLQMTLLQGSPTFSWEMAEGAEKYEIQVADEPAFHAPQKIDITTTQPAYTPQTGMFLDGTPYYWRVRIRQSEKSPFDAWSAVQQFNVSRPVIGGLFSIPVNSAKQPAQANPSLCWSPVIGAYAYFYEIATDLTFNPLYLSGTTEQSCITVTSGTKDGHFFWRVRLVDGAGIRGPASAAAEYWKYYPVPIRIEPTGNVSGTPIFRWGAVTGADQYLFQIADSPGFTNILYSVQTVNVEHRPLKMIYPGQNMHTCFWRVVVIDRDGNLGWLSSIQYKLFIPFIRQ